MRFAIPAVTIVFGLAIQTALAQESEAKYKEVLQKMIDTMGKMTDVLEAVTDEESAKAKRSILRVQVQEFLDARKLTETVAPPPAEIREKLVEEFRPKFEKANLALRAQIARVQRVPGGNATLQEIRGVFEKAAP